MITNINNYQRNEEVDNMEQNRMNGNGWNSPQDNPAYGTQPNYGNVPYGAQQNYGNANMPYGAQPGYGSANTAYGAQPGYGNANTSYGAQPGYGGTNNAYGTQSKYENAPYEAQQDHGDAKAVQTDAQVKTEDKKGRKAKEKKHPSGEGKRPFGVTLAKCAAIALIFGLVAGSVFAGTNHVWNLALAGDEQERPVSVEQKPEDDDKAGSTPVSANVSGTVMDVSQVVEHAMPAIVAITNISVVKYPTWFGGVQSREQESCGSGIIIRQDEDYIYIATNNHVVSGAKQLTVQFSDDYTAAGQVKGTDESTDLAVVAVHIDELPEETQAAIKVATLGSSESLKVGQPSIAIGNALGWGQSVTTGCISALNREVTVEDEYTGASVTNELIQTDAAINPGNSGGALLNINGEVIGINSVKYGDTYVEGMGYAIPIDTAGPILDSLINSEEVSGTRSAYLGVVCSDVTQSVADSYGMPLGLYVRDVVEGSAAEAAGLQKGDVITVFAGRSVGSKRELDEALQSCQAGQQVEITYQRQVNGEYRENTVTVTLGSKN